MLDNIEKAIIEIMLKILEDGSNPDGEELDFDWGRYAIVASNDDKSISLHWKDGAITVSNWKRNWIRTAEVFTTAIKHDNM